MTFQIITQIILFAIALSMDAFAVAVTDGLVYKDINKRKAIFIALTFGLMQGIMPLIGYWLIELVSYLAGTSSSVAAGNIMSLTVTWIAFALLLFIGGKMFIEAIINMKKPLEEKKEKLFSIKEVLLMGVATAIDALAVGVSLHSGTLSNNSTIWLHAGIITLCTFIISLLGVILARWFHKLLKGKYEITGIIGGVILVLLAIWVVISHYIGL